MSKNNTLERSDKLIVCLAAFCAVLLFSWLVHDISFSRNSIEGLNQIGHIYQTKNKVKRKSNTSLIWYAADDDEIVYENDWIFTGDDSVAKIKLDAGGEIIIEPGSLIILSRKDGLLQLDLKHGRMLADIKSETIKINIVRQGKVETVDTSRGPIEVKQTDEGAQTEVLALNEKIVESEAGAEIDADAAISLEQFADRKLFQPEEGFSTIEDNGISAQIYSYKATQLFPEQKTNLPLIWSDPFGRWSSYEYQLATDKEFTDLLAIKQTPAQGVQVPTRDAGIYHWRVRGLDKDGKASEWTKPLISELDIKLIEKGPPVRFAKKTIPFQLEKPDLKTLQPDRTHKLTVEKPLSISWTKDKNATQYRFQVSNEPDFSDIIEEKILPETKKDLSTTKLGKTFFRVIPENDKGESVAAVSTGTVHTLLPAPANDSLKTIDNDDFQTLRWSPVDYAETYEVTYSHSKNNEEPPIIEYVKNNRLRVPNKTGFLKWKVRVVETTSKEKMSPYTTTVDWYDAAKRLASLHGTGQAGTLYPKITKPETRKTFISLNQAPLFIVMNWTYEKEALGYDVEISRTPDMRQLVYKKVVNNQKRAVIRQKFKAGVYYMRVRAKHQTVSDESWSKSEVFRVINRD